VIPKTSSASNSNNNSNIENNNNDIITNADAKEKNRHQELASDQEFNDISAVAIVGDKKDNSSTNTIIRCAVARVNKTLNIYNITPDDIKVTSSTRKKKTSLSYRTPKRVNCFTFSDLPMDGSSINTTVPLLISGDVAGDSYAYNMLKNGQRRLLGHTASMLTDVAIVNQIESSHRRRLLLTADRDEKIRISQFPDSHLIEGFLLGHTKYITAFTTIPSSSIVVSCGGDMTLRLWNIEYMNEICSTSTCTTTDDGCDSSGASSGSCSNKNEIPTAIAVSGCGRIIAVIFDESKRLSIYKISNKEMNSHHNGNDLSLRSIQSSLTLMVSVCCPSQPLSVIFHGTEVNAKNDHGIALTVLMGDPNYIVRYNIQDKHDSNNSDKQVVVVPATIENSCMQALLDIALKEEISMPRTILEKDDYGKPVIGKENETRGPAAAEAPWNRVERVEIHKERERKRKKKNRKI